MTTTGAPALDLEGLRALVPALGQLVDPSDDAGRVDAIRLLEELKSAVAAAQAVVTARFVASQTAAQVDVGVRAERVGQGIASQVALAKRESPARARRYVGWTKILVRELPHTFTALREGRISEWRAQIVARETAWLDLPGRTLVDEQLAPRLEELGDGQVEAEAKKLAYRYDPQGFVARIAKAEAERRVSLRPAPDAMTFLTGLLPMAQGVAAYAALTKHADAVIAAGDERSKSQIMADTMVERLTGQTVAEGVPVEVNLVMTDQALFNTDTRPDADTGPDAHAGSDAGTGEAGAGEPATVVGYGPVPVELARRIAQQAARADQLWVRRLYTDPETGQLIAMDSRSRFFPAGLAKFLILRDQVCRTPWCDAPIRHSDHVTPAEHDGPTSAGNGQGLCVACNHAKQAPGWTSRAGPQGAGVEVTITTPTGHWYRSRPPDPPGTRRARHVLSPAERHLAALLDAA